MEISKRKNGYVVVAISHGRNRAIAWHRDAGAAFKKRARLSKSGQGALTVMSALEWRGRTEVQS